MFSASGKRNGKYVVSCCLA